MKYAAMLTLMKSANSTKKMYHILFFALLNNTPADFMEILGEVMQKKSGLSEEQIRKGFSQCHVEWSEKLDRADEYLNECSRIDTMIEPLISRNSSDFTRENLTSLFRTVVSLSLQKASLLDLKNHMKEKDIRTLLDCFESKKYPELLKSLKKILSFVSKGNELPTGSYFTEEVLALCDLLADFYLARLRNDSRISVCYDFIRDLPFMKEQDIESYLTTGTMYGPDNTILYRNPAPFMLY